jgi:hypothetical protein
MRIELGGCLACLPIRLTRKFSEPRVSSCHALLSWRHVRFGDEYQGRGCPDLARTIAAAAQSSATTTATMINIDIGSALSILC